METRAIIHSDMNYPWSTDRLVIGKFCQIASGVEFVMNAANHQMNAVSTFPFYTLEGWNMNPPEESDMPECRYSSRSSYR